MSVLPTCFEHQVPLLSRTAFREGMIARDGGRCVSCGRQDRPLDAHHLLERRLFAQGGYHLDNGVTLCDDRWSGCHVQGERTLLSPGQLRARAGITRRILPDWLTPEQQYDKWGNLVLKAGRSPGPLFWEPSVQSILAEGGVLGHFTRRVALLRLLPVRGFSNRPGPTVDSSVWLGQQVQISAWPSTPLWWIYSDDVHGEDLENQRNSPALDTLVRHLRLDQGLRFLVAESCSGFVGLSLWERDLCFDTVQTAEYLEVLELPAPKALYEGPYQELGQLEQLASESETSALFVRLSRALHWREWPEVTGWWGHPSR